MTHVNHKKVKMKKPQVIVSLQQMIYVFLKEENKQKIKDEPFSWRTYWNTLPRVCYLHIE